MVRNFVSDIQSSLALRLAPSARSRAGTAARPAAGLSQSARSAVFFRLVQHCPYQRRTNRRLLKPGGLAMNHGITAGGLANRQPSAGMGDFIEKYIFPGGELVHASAVVGHMAQAGLEMVEAENLRPHCARTLWEWSDALEAKLDAAWQILSEAGGTARAERILRVYRLYLAGSAMCFDEGWISLHQFLATCTDAPPAGVADLKTRAARTAYPFNRHYMYPNAGNG